MSLQNEIRPVLSGMYASAETIIWRVGQDRIKREDYSKLPSRKRFTNVLAEMGDVEAGVDKGKRVWRRKSVETEQRNICYRCRAILLLTPVTGLTERLHKQLTRILQWIRNLVPPKKLAILKTATRKSYQRFKLLKSALMKSLRS